MRELRNSHASIMGWGIFLAGALSLGSCSGDETINEIQGEAITFGKAFVENSTRAIDPSYGTDKPVDQFKVWGTVTGNTNNSVLLYNGATVTRNETSGAYECGQTEYWIPSATYNFMAIANATSVTPTSGTPTAINYTADGTTDLLLSEVSNKGIKSVTADATAVPSENPVAFTFSHLLSKAVFTFNNVDANATLTVTDIKMAGLNTTGTYTIENGTWSSSTAATTPLAFGGSSVEAGKSATCEYERLIIPGTYTLTITFTVNDNIGGEAQEISATIENHEFVKGNSYNFTADIKSGRSYIIFTIQSTDWSNGSDTSIQG